MKNQYKQRQRQIEKSIRGDWTQNIYYFEDKNKIKEKREKKENKPKLVFKNGKLIQRLISLTTILRFSNFQQFFNRISRLFR
jgi:NCAIR mutase (PurE)-related protein